ncbi:hypothetical protein L1887_21013 [Cichorium endivia]|nr:hypothetical protein L1887_21013 [Cichorium endivia]
MFEVCVLVCEKGSVDLTSLFESVTLMRQTTCSTRGPFVYSGRYSLPRIAYVSQSHETYFSVHRQIDENIDMSDESNIEFVYELTGYVGDIFVHLRLYVTKVLKTYIF